MSEARNLSQLWRFIDDSLRPHSEFGVASLSKENEREILLDLSQVRRRIQVWNEEDESDCDTDLAMRVDYEIEFSAQFGSKSEEIDCLSKITVKLVHLLTIDSRYIQHLVGNVLVVVSEFAAKNESHWEEFIRFLCLSLDLAVKESLSHSPTVSFLGNEGSNNSSLSFVLALQDKLKNVNWLVVASIIRVLRCILKHGMLDDNARLTSIYYDSVNSCFSNLPWDSFIEIFGVWDYGAQKGCFERFMFMGNIIQLLCSLVAQSGNHLAFSLSIVLVPKLLSWCLSNGEDYGNNGTIQYFRHKILVLMIRISSETPLDCCVLVSWLQLLKQYFGEVLKRPIASFESVQNDSLEGSPFLPSILDEELNDSSILHIQRRAVFLFLRCSLSLINSKTETNEKCVCSTSNLCLSNDSNVESEFCGRKRGLIELNNWLQWHFSADILANEEIYSQKRVDFTLAFLRLFMHEDDLLFRMLLELLCLPNPSEKQSQKNKLAFKDAKQDVLVRVSKLFNPLHLFHLFLSELHYDHQVLLDYLISKDTGTSSAEYLLRCLRVHCDSWRLFVEFSIDGKLVNQSTQKKRKYNFVDQLYEEDKGLEVLRKPYKEAKECLLSLLVSVENLHQKKLFPYNPKVLLKRLMAFQELCCEERTI